MKRSLLLLSSSLLLAACQSHSVATDSNKMTDNLLSKDTQEMTSSDMTKVHTLVSRYDYIETISRLKSAIAGKDMTLFAEINHTKAAKEAGLDMQPATVLVFGHPKAGTPLMKKDPSFALQLPLKVLITEVDNQVKVSFNDTRALIQGSGIEYSDVENSLAGAEKLITNTVTQ